MPRDSIHQSRILFVWGFLDSFGSVLGYRYSGERSEITSGYAVEKQSQFMGDEAVSYHSVSASLLPFHGVVAN